MRQCYDKEWKRKGKPPKKKQKVLAVQVASRSVLLDLLEQLLVLNLQVAQNEKEGKPVQPPRLPEF